MTHCSQIEYWATIKRKGFECDYQVWQVPENMKIIEELEQGKLKPEDIYGLLYENDGFYGKSHLDLHVNSWHFDEAELLKSGWDKVVKLEKFEIGVIKQDKLF